MIRLSAKGFGFEADEIPSEAFLASFQLSARTDMGPSSKIGKLLPRMPKPPRAPKAKTSVAQWLRIKEFRVEGLV